MSKTIRLYRPKLSRKAILLTLRNLGYQCRMGLSTMIGELAISCTMIVGNYMFMSRLHEDGVAAFSVACYLFPLIFMFGNAVAQSSLPIISYNYGLGAEGRVRQTFRVAIVTAALGGLVITILGVVLSPQIATVFLSTTTAAYGIAVKGLPYFALGFVLLSINLALIGYFQSLSRAGAAITFMLMRGIVLLVPIFVLLPSLIGDVGLWLAIPLSEALTLICIVVYYFSSSGNTALKSK